MDLTTLLTWLSNAAGTALVLLIPLAVPAWRATVGRYLAGLMQHHFDERLEGLKSQLRKAEETFKNELRQKEQQIRTLVDTTLSQRSSRQTALDARRLQAVEKLWAAKSKLDRLKLAASFMSGINFEVAARQSGKDEKTRTLFSMLDKTALGDKMEDLLTSIEPERPFLTPVVWAAYSAYQSVLHLPAVQLKFLASGVGEPDLINTKHASDLLKATLPQFKDYIDKYGAAAHYQLLEILEQNLLKAVWDMLEGKETDAATLAHAAEIIHLAGEVQRDKVSDAKIPKDLRGDSAPPIDPKDLRPK
ncbi:MAG: hypothetical protein JW889_02280 [Verrucomicrobia bacterium]|nr:hypothetical protein [Verrucomicrobiota bacterium]